MEYQFSRDFDNLPIVIPEVPAIRHVMTHAVPFFPALIIYGMLLGNDEIELVGIEVDPDYWNLIGGDPTD